MSNFWGVYQIGGYTLINNSQGLYLVSYLPFSSSEEVIKNYIDLKSEITTLKKYDKRILVKETDKGKALQGQIEVLKNLLNEY